MNRALWNKAVADAWQQLAISSALMALFGWAFVWLQSLVKVGVWGKILHLLPDFVGELTGVPMELLATQTGRLSILYVHFVPLFLCLGWAIGRGSDAVSGGIAKGTLELVLTLPVRRVSVLFSHAVVSTAGAAVLAISLWLGNWLGLATFRIEGDVSIRQFVPGSFNLFALTFSLTGITAFLSSWDRDRWRTMWLAGGYFVLSAIIKMVARLWEPGGWLRHLSVLTAFEPQKLILLPGGDGLALRYNGALLAVGLATYFVAALIFTRRDIPVPR